MNTTNVFRIGLAALMLFFGIRAVKTKKFSGIANATPWQRGIYAHAKKDFKITGRGAVWLGIFMILGGIYLIGLVVTGE